MRIGEDCITNDIRVQVTGVKGKSVSTGVQWRTEGKRKLVRCKRR